MQDCTWHAGDTSGATRLCLIMRLTVLVLHDCASLPIFCKQCYHRNPFPVTAKQLRYLIERNYIDFPLISKKGTWDKSKFDTAAKCFALIPVINLLANTIARYPQGLPVTPLELFTLSFLPPSLGTIYFTLSKPLNVSSPVELKAQKTV